MRRLLRGALVLAFLLIATAIPATAQEPPTIQRLAGPERISTAVALSTSTWADQTAEAVVLARADRFPDALAGGPLAAARRGPLLLTPQDALAPMVQEEIQRVLPEGGTVYLLGLEAALSEDVAQQVADAGFVAERIGGDSRYATALAIAREAAPDGPGFMVIASGNEYPDALIAGALATPFVGGVVVLSDQGALPQAAQEYVDAHPDAAKTTIGPDGAEAYPTAFNVAGATPEERSVAAAEAFYDELDPPPGGVALASVAAFPDGLAGAPHALFNGRLPLLLVPADELPQAHRDYIAGLEANGPSYVYGGNAAINEIVVDQLRAALAQ